MSTCLLSRVVSFVVVVAAAIRRQQELSSALTSQDSTKQNKGVETKKEILISV